MTKLPLSPYSVKESGYLHVKKKLLTIVITRLSSIRAMGRKPTTNLINEIVFTVGLNYVVR